MRAFLAAGAATAVLLGAAAGAAAKDVDVLVGFKGGADAKVVEKHGGKASATLDRVRAVAATLPASAVAALRADPDVAYVEEDGIVEAIADAAGKPGGSGPAPTPPPAQSVPWGVARVGAPVAGNTGAGVKVAIVDTGIDLGHDDLEANLKPGATFVARTSTANDDNGHGTHVAGTVAAADNAIGVVGVAPAASLHPVKVLDKRGSGLWSAVAAGITWTADNGMHVANMSLGGSAYSATLQNACDDAAARGVLLVAAAGNEGDGSASTTEISYPAAFASVVAVGATSSTDALASFSNTGSFVYASAPGVAIPSTYKGNLYKTLNGTSMACPHAAGVAALLWNAIASPTAAAVKAEMKTRAVDLGAAGFDAGFGWGLAHY